MNEEEYIVFCEKEHKEAVMIWCAIEDALKSNMHIEFIMSFMEEFERTKDICKSIYYAKCEWDL